MSAQHDESTYVWQLPEEENQFLRTHHRLSPQSQRDLLQFIREVLQAHQSRQEVPAEPTAPDLADRAQVAERLRELCARLQHFLQVAEPVAHKYQHAHDNSDWNASLQQACIQTHLLWSALESVNSTP